MVKAERYVASFNADKRRLGRIIQCSERAAKTTSVAPSVGKWNDSIIPPVAPIKSLERQVMKRRIVMVVEDEPMNRLMAVDAFERAGFDVMDFGRTDEVLSCAERMPDEIAALFTDINVPGDDDGMDLARRFADRWPETPVLVTSGCFGEDAPADLPSSAGFIPKPWTVKALMARLQDDVVQRQSDGAKKS
ncbi:response regulator [Lichenifustis flavocetrariae]|uniref:Response regulator n=1 Tax=Lichenifustis flavocetrariae TaxID=2949735 RepID=A0AA41YU80_9HYPH|nr:response regulator [Lichenifustis flavocetrariae]MCW6507331.1 response regulator [Lichenifustis flavocetrariae]